MYKWACLLPRYDLLILQLCTLRQRLTGKHFRTRIPDRKQRTAKCYRNTTKIVENDEKQETGKTQEQSARTCFQTLQIPFSGRSRYLNFLRHYYLPQKSCQKRRQTNPSLDQYCEYLLYNICTATTGSFVYAIKKFWIFLYMFIKI